VRLQVLCASLHPTPHYRRATQSAGLPAIVDWRAGRTDRKRPKSEYWASRHSFRNDYFSLHVDGVTAAVNYGLDRVRFPTPLPSGTKVRTTGHLAAATPLAGGVRVDIRMTLETESSTKPGVRCRSSGPAARL